MDDLNETETVINAFLDKLEVDPEIIEAMRIAARIAGIGRDITKADDPENVT